MGAFPSPFAGYKEYTMRKLFFPEGLISTGSFGSVLAKS
jgi:hypothetical protein